MKRILLSLFFLQYFIIPFVAECQDSTSRFEKFSNRSGTMIKTESRDIGKVRDISVKIYKATDLGTDANEQAILISQIPTSILSMGGNIGFLYIDWEELDGAIKSLNFYKTLIGTKPENQISYSFKTKNGVDVNCQYNPTGYMSGWSLSMNNRYKYLGYTKDGSTIILKNKDIDDFVSLMEKVKSYSF